MQTIETSIWAIGSTSNDIHLTFESFNGTDPIFPKNNTLLHPSRAFFPTMRGAKRGEAVLPVYRDRHAHENAPHLPHKKKYVYVIPFFRGPPATFLKAKCTSTGHLSNKC